LEEAHVSRLSSVGLVSGRKLGNGELCPRSRRSTKNRCPAPGPSIRRRDAESTARHESTGRNRWRHLNRSLALENKHSKWMLVNGYYMYIMNETCLPRLRGIQSNLEIKVGRRRTTHSRWCLLLEERVHRSTNHCCSPDSINIV